MKLLHIVATPRASESNTLRISRPFLEHLQIERPDLQIDTLNVFTKDLPAVAGRNIETKYHVMKGLPVGPVFA